MKALAAVVILMGAAAILRAVETNPTATVSPTPAPQQARAANSSADLTEAEFALKFEDGASYADYKKLKPENRVAVNQAWNQIPTGTKGPSGELIKNLQQLERQANTTNDTSGARGAVNRVTDQLSGKCDGEMTREGCKDTSAVVPAGGPANNPDSGKGSGARQKAETQPQGNVTVKAPPPPDAPPAEPKAAAPDAKMQSLLKNATLGALAGAAVGIGLLPLLGPIGILVGAALGAAMMVVGKKLAG